ncbi:MAG: hypothetical protein WBQ18_20120 [Solirubrobacteraceae bacterium]
MRFATQTIRISVRTAQDALELAEGVCGLIRSGHSGHSGHSSPNGHGGHAADAPVTDVETATVTVVDADFAATPPQADPVGYADEVMDAHVVEEVIDPPPTSPATPVTEPAHVSEEPELAESVAETGAEDGAGAEVRIAEPWDGYRLMNAAEIIDRLATASSAELAAVELYELSSRKRKSVLAAAQRRLKQSSPPR